VTGLETLPPLAPTYVERCVEAARAALARRGVAAGEIAAAEELTGIWGILPLRVRCGSAASIAIAARGHDDTPVIVPREERRARTPPENWPELLIAELERSRAALPPAQTALLDEVAPFVRARRLEDEFFEVEAAHGTLLCFAGWNESGAMLHLSFGPGFGAAERAWAARALAFDVAPVDAAFRVIWGGSTAATNYHHRTRQQRFAVDLEPFTARAVAVRAPLSGRVVRAVDGESDALARDDPRRVLAPFGNHVVLEAGDVHVHLAHLAHGSVRVAAGEHVPAGTVLGAVGDSGWSSRRHLHVHATAACAPHHAVPVLWRVHGVVRELRRGDVVDSNM
jgi:murein DD-endopeptidase MepM/ murein hydrolase activator NlpD